MKKWNKKIENEKLEHSEIKIVSTVDRNRQKNGQWSLEVTF